MSKQKEFQKRLRALMAKPENQICSDCPDPKPTWASIIVPPEGSSPDKSPMGAFCCYQCSGAHRRLGVHISFVRSITLDDWKEKEVIAMENGGNAKVNAVYEGGDGFSKSLKPQKGAELDTREKFIRDKYERRKYYDDKGHTRFNTTSQILQKMRTRRISTSSAIDLAEPIESFEAFEDFESHNNDKDSTDLFDLLVESRADRSDPTCISDDGENGPVGDTFGSQFSGSLRNDKSSSGFCNAGISEDSFDPQERLERNNSVNSYDRPNENENEKYEARAKGARRKPRKIGDASMPEIAVGNTSGESRRGVQRKPSGNLLRGVKRHFSADDKTFISVPAQQRQGGGPGLVRQTNIRPKTLYRRKRSDEADLKYPRASPSIAPSNSRRLDKAKASEGDELMLEDNKSQQNSGRHGKSQSTRSIPCAEAKDEKDRKEKENKRDAKLPGSWNDLLKKHRESKDWRDILKKMEKTGLKENKQAVGSDSSDLSKHSDQDLDGVYHDRQEFDRPQRSYSCDETYSSCKVAPVKPARLGLEKSESGRSARNGNGRGRRNQKARSEGMSGGRERAQSAERLPRCRNKGTRNESFKSKDRSGSKERWDNLHGKERARSVERLPRYDSASKRNNMSSSKKRCERKDSGGARSRSIERLSRSHSTGTRCERSRGEEKPGSEESLPPLQRLPPLEPLPPLSPLPRLSPLSPLLPLSPMSVAI